jgi:trigger factor
MKTEVKKIDKLKRIITVTIEEENLSRDRKEAYAEIGKSLKVPGFRPGSAPLDVLEKRYSGSLKEEFLKKMLPVYYKNALDENKLITAGNPDISDIEFTDKSLKFCAQLEIKPQLELDEAEYRGIKVKDKAAEVKEEEIEKVLTNIKEEIKKATEKDLNDDDLARWAGYPNIAGFREAVKAEIFVEKLRERRRKIDSQISKHLLDKIKTDIPRHELEERHKELMDRELYHLRSRNIPEEDIEKYKKDIEEKLKPLAEEEVKLYYILEAIAKKEGLKPEHNLGEVVLGYLLSQADYTE